MTETITSTAPLTPEDVAFATELCLDHYTNRFNERLIQDAADEKKALRAILQYNSYFGHFGPFGNYELEARHNRITFSREGREGVITWTQIVRTVRAKLAAATVKDGAGEQLLLFPDFTP